MSLSLKPHHDTRCSFPGSSSESSASLPLKTPQGDKCSQINSTPLCLKNPSRDLTPVILILSSASSRSLMRLISPSSKDIDRMKNSLSYFLLENPKSDPEESTVKSPRLP